MKAHILKFLFFALTFGPGLLAETQNTLELTAPQLFPGYTETFNASQTSGPVAVASGTIESTYSGATKFTLTSASGRYDGFAGKSFYGLSMGPYQLFRSFLSSNFLTVVSSSTGCPSATTYNWLGIRFRPQNASRGAMDARATDFIAGGTLAYDPNTVPLATGSSTFDLKGPTLDKTADYNFDGFNSAICDDGSLKVAAGGTDRPLDNYGTLLFGDSSFIFMASGGNPVAAIGVASETLSGPTLATLSKSVFTGLYTAYASTQVQKNIYIVPDAAGTTYSLYTADDVSNPSSKTSLGTLACTTLNSPSNGFCSGTLNLAGVGETGNAVCMISTLSPENIIACVAQQPGGLASAVSIIGRIPRKAVLAASASASSVSVAKAGDSAVITITLTNLTGKPIATMGDPSNGALKLAAPFSNVGAYGGAGGSCGSTLGGYASCTLDVTFSPSAVGTYMQTFRTAYDDGYFGTVNATLRLIGSAGLSSIAVSPTTANFPAGSTVQYVATATYSDASTQDISQAVTWSTSDANIATMSSQGTAKFVTTGSVTFTATLGANSDNQAVTAGSGGTIEVLGQPNPDGIVGALTGLNAPRNVIVAGGRLFVADTSNHRVLIWNAIPKTLLVSPDLVLGQPSMDDKIANNGGRAANTLSSPKGLASDGTYLVVADSGNHRVLIWNSIPTVDQQDADVVIGQANLTAGTSNSGGISAKSLSGPTDVALTGGKLYIADAGNHRVVIFNSIPSANQKSADVVLGQPDMASRTANNGGVTAQSLNGPESIATDGTRLWVSDYNNNRVLCWTSLPTSNTQAANYVLGQPDMVSSTANNGGLTAQTLKTPHGLYSDGSKLYVTDEGNNRVLIWNSLPSSNQQAADVVLGQSLFTTATANNGGISSQSLNAPMGITVASGVLYVGDTTNNRVLAWNSVPSVNKTAADFVLGQAVFTKNDANSVGTPSAQTLNRPQNVSSDGTRFVVADYSNHRVLIWSKTPTANGDAASIVLGQPDMASNTANNGGRTASTLNNPYHAFSDGTRLYVADYSNNRVLIWNSIPKSNGQAADVVLGQTNFTSGGANAGGRSAQSLSGPTSVYSDGTRLVVTDYNNHRALIWNTIPASNKKAADIVLGQPDFVSGTANNGGISAQTMQSPRGVVIVGSKLFVADYANARVLGWSTFPTSNQQAADIVLGQPDFVSRTQNNGGISATSLNRPSSVHSDGTSLFVSDYNTHRALVWDAIPTGVQTAADRVIGQTSFTTNTANNGGISNKSLYNPTGIFSDGMRAWISDYNNYRVLVVSVRANLSISDGPSYDYGDVVVGNAANKTFKVTNIGSGTASSMKAGSPALSTPFLFVGGSYPGTGGTCGATLAGQASCNIVVRFNPSLEAASFSDVVRVEYSDGVDTKVAVVGVTGRSVLQSTLTFTDGASYNFGTKNKGTNNDKTLTVSNASGVTASLMREGTPALSAPFSFVGGSYPGTGGTCGTLLTTGNTCTVVVRYSPTAAVLSSTTFKVQYNNGSVTANASITLQGTGQ